MNCDTVVKQLSLMLYGELSFDEEEAVHLHLDSCASCQSRLAATRQFHADAGIAAVALPPQLLSDARRTLRVSVSALRDSGLQASPSRPWQRLLPASWSWNALWKPVGAVTLLAIGFLGGRVLPAGGASMQVRGPVEPVSSRVRFVQPEESGRVQIVVEEVRQRVLEGGVNDDGIRALLVSAAREANDPGVRVETMDLLKPQAESAEVRRALLAALQHDGNPGVRLKALEALRGNRADGETRRVLAQVLLTDNNPGVRTQAIDLLTAQHEPDMAGLLQELMSREENNYVRLKCQKALREMNASVETF